MNVLETLKIDKATVLELKDNDILFIQAKDNANAENMNEIARELMKAINKKGYENIHIMIASSIENIKIIRR